MPSRSRSVAYLDKASPETLQVVRLLVIGYPMERILRKSLFIGDWARGSVTYGRLFFEFTNAELGGASDFEEAVLANGLKEVVVKDLRLAVGGQPSAVSY